MSTGPPHLNELLIASVTPQNLERGILWFKENFSSLKKARISNPWWRENTLVLENDLQLQPSQLARKLIDLGYERTEIPRGKGAFSVRGGIIEVWPVNEDLPFLIEFRGNAILAISSSPPREEKIKPRITSRSVEKLPEGSFVVHVDHGIGIFRGIINKNTEPNAMQKNINQVASDRVQLGSGKKINNSYLVIEYAAPAPGIPPDRLLVPTDQKNRLSPYIGFETPRIHRLGGSMWQNTKRKIKEDAENLARELLSLYARREKVTRPPYEGDQILEEEIKHRFTFAETEDQIRAEEEIMRDLSRARPMDRILCGDVGFGKTEIALRAASRVMSSGRQIAVLSPTTVLAAQHMKTFCERLDGLPFKIAMLSRLTPPKAQKETLNALAAGAIDGIIGTHRLFSRDVIFKDLGLVIIDEEQRFGVKQKERFKELRSEVDLVRNVTRNTSPLTTEPEKPNGMPSQSTKISNGVDLLSLSATPIPRTLSLALAKIRDISRIATPPPNRKSIQTFVLPHAANTVKKAMEFEIARGGQLYFLHNRIETIGKVKERLQGIKLSRPLRIETIHGRMKEKEMMRAMERFREQKCDVLLATTIIENGIDISSANTLIVDDATRLGLADAHQLRGRIGRGAVQAHAYFLYRPSHLTPKSLERLEALREYADLGAGYEIALRDLEIRGAGNVFGREQSGAVNRVGLNLYCEMLSDAIDSLQTHS